MRLKNAYIAGAGLLFFLASASGARAVDLWQTGTGFGENVITPTEYTTGSPYSVYATKNLFVHDRAYFPFPDSGITFSNTSSATNSPMIYMFPSGASNTNRMVIAHSPDDANWGLQYRDNNDIFDFISNGYSVFKVDLATGRVGIGMDSPLSYQLQLSQDAAAKPNGGSWTNPSDRRLKENVMPFTDGLNVIKQMRTVRYTYNGLGGTPKGLEGIGVIAQELQPVAPYMVTTHKGKLNPTDTSETELYDVNPSALNFVNANAIKELDNKLGKGKAGKATCWKDNGSLGWCSSAIDKTGSCSCN